MKLLHVLTLKEARAELSARVRKIPHRRKTVPLSDAAGLILAEDVRAPADLPGFRRSTVDGYAVIAADTHGASDTIPVFLEITEHIRIGEEPLQTIMHGQCAYVPTGGMLPDGADAMVMAEYCEAFSDSEIAVSRSVATGNHTVLPGDDMKKGNLLLPEGTRLRFQEIGALAAAGLTSVTVCAPFTAAIISTGNELVSPGQNINGCRIYDSNTYALSVQAGCAGLDVVRRQLLPDDRDRLRQAILSASADCDLVILSGGSSQGKHDMTETLFQEISAGGVYAHGLALKPGKPTVLAWDDAHKTALIGLPGHPAAASMVFELLVSPVLKYTLPAGNGFPLYAEPSLSAFLTVNVASSPGRETCVPVKLALSEGALLASPIPGPSGLWSPLVQADGYILISENREGLPAGHPVDVYLLRR
ncbi:MAG: molybdopterin molybdotransferase MoeA [Clostridiales bacterium]|nr:molybdopterin molybdotransferase MoeA [Clostridiales bacterium]